MYLDYKVSEKYYIGKLTEEPIKESGLSTEFKSFGATVL